MGLFKLVTMAKVASTALNLSEDGFYLTVGAVRKGAKFYFVFQTCKWDDAEVELAIETTFGEKRQPRVYSFPNGGGSNN